MKSLRKIEKWSDDVIAQREYIKVALFDKKQNEKTVREIENQKRINKRLRETLNREQKAVKKEYDRLWQIKKRKKAYIGDKTQRLTSGFGYCVSCGCLDLDILEEHHVFGAKYDDFTITLCPNCHMRIHLFMGKTLGSTTS